MNFLNTYAYLIAPHAPAQWKHWKSAVFIDALLPFPYSDVMPSLADRGRKVLGKFYRFPAVKRFKDEVGVPVRNAIFGKKAFYEVLEIVRELERKQGKEVKIVFDIGASIGDKAYVMARAFPHAQMYCFEPHPISFKHLEKRMARFGNRVHCFNFGFYNTEGTLDFYADGAPEKEITSTGTSSLIPRDKQFRFDIPVDGGTIKVQVRRLDDFVREQGIEKIDFMKIDVESAEKELIECGKEGLKRTDNLFIEIMPMRRGVHSHIYIDVLEAIYQTGLSFYGTFEDFFFTRLVSDK